MTMGRHNHRRHIRTTFEPSRYYGTCAYCGRRLGPNNWHWMWDEFGQRVKKCNNERRCYDGRSRESSEAFKRAFRI